MGIYHNLLTSDVWLTPPHSRCVYIAICDMVDKDGRLTATVGTIALRANVPADLCAGAVDILLRQRFIVSTGKNGWWVPDYEILRMAEAEIVGRDLARLRQQRKRARDKSSRTNGRRTAKSRVAK